MATKRDENSRRYKLKTERAKIKLQEINDEFLLTAPAAELWTLTRDQAAARIDKLPAQLLEAVRDRRRSPGEAQVELQSVIYTTLTEIATGALVDRAVKQFKKKARR